MVVGAMMAQALGVVEGEPFLALLLVSFLRESNQAENQTVRIDQEIGRSKEDAFPHLENQLECSMKKAD